MTAGIEAAAYLPFDLPRWKQYEHRIRRLMTDLGTPNSISLAEAMKQLIRDVEHIDKNTRPSSSAPVERREAVARIIDPAAFKHIQRVKSLGVFRAPKTQARIDSAYRIADAILPLPGSSRDEVLSKVGEIVDLYFAPWGAAKGAMWEELTGDKPFDPEVALREIQSALKSGVAK